VTRDARTTTGLQVRLAARGSALSIAQVEWVARALAHAGSATASVQTFRTTGDRLSHDNENIVGKGVFTKEIDEALLDGRADVGVHSCKDLPSELPPGLVLAAIPPREDPSDVLVSRARATFASLPAGARIGTGSPRRRAQLLAARPDLSVSEARGNVDTRIRRLEEGRWDAIVLARAGLARLGRLDEVCEVFSADVLLPAIGQGALALVARAGDAESAAALAALDHLPTHREILAERRLLTRLHAGCRAPLAALASAAASASGLAAAPAVTTPGTLRLSAAVFSHDGRETIREDEAGLLDDPIGLADRVADRLLARGADRILQEARS